MNNSFLDQLNLRPQEKRIIFVIGIIVFLVLYVVMVIPHFSDWSRIKKDLEKTSATYRSETNEIGRDVDPTNGYRKQLARLEREQKGGVSQFDQSHQFQKTINTQAPKCGVEISSSAAGPVSQQAATNEFFDEQTVQLTFVAGESNLVAFLYNVGNDPSMIRVRELHLNAADANRYRLKGSLLLAANYEKHTVAAAEPAGKGPVKSTTSAKPGPPGTPPAKGPGATPPTPSHVADRKKI